MGFWGLFSLKFRELSKIFSQKLCIAEIVLGMKISSWNLCARTHAVSAWNYQHIFDFLHFREIILSSRSVSEPIPWYLLEDAVSR